VDTNRRLVVAEHGLTAAGLLPTHLHALQAVHMGLHLP
jgi:hypothetical protein